MNYRWRPGIKEPAVSAEVVGTTIAAIIEATPAPEVARRIVDEARPKGSQLHGFFEWDDAAIAERVRHGQARQLIRMVHVEHPTQGTIRAFAVVTPAPVTVTRAAVVQTPASDSADRLERAQRELEQLRARYGDLEALKPVVEAINRFLSSVQAPTATPRRRCDACGGITATDPCGVCHKAWNRAKVA